MPQGFNVIAFGVLIFGSKDVTTAGTAVQLLTSATETGSITIKAKSSNGVGKLIYVGDSTVSSSNGFRLKRGESVSLDVDNKKVPIFIDADQNGDGVNFIGGRI